MKKYLKLTLTALVCAAAIAGCSKEQNNSAVEPDEDVIVKTDTIAIVNKEIEVSPMNKWYKLILQNKYAEIVANTTAKAVSSAINGGLDALTKNI